jgi:hypothetical protein
MPKLSPDEQLAALVARRNRTDAAIRRLKSKTDKKARADDTRRKVIAGALALEHTSKNRGSEFARRLVRLLDEYARPQDRFLFADLLLDGPPLPADAANLTSDQMRAIAPESLSDAAAQ